MFVNLFLLFLVHTSEAVIYRLNDADYALMPPLFHLDPYEACYLDPEGLYCNVDLTLVSDEPSPLLTMIQEYSEHKITHFNHTLLHRGICVTQKCKKFYENKKEDLKLTLEACLNESLYNEYRLKTKVLDDFDCSNHNKHMDVDVVDITVGLICIFILCANIVGSICDYLFKNEKYNGVLKYVYCFSIFRNWKKLVAPPNEGQDSRLQQLKGLHGIRVINTAFVIMSHAFFPITVPPENPEYFESIFHYKPFHIILNGTTIMQTFLIISAFLLVYNWLLYAEKIELSWEMLPKVILLRWLRLTPVYAVILGLTATWFGRISSGPLWKKFVASELTDCRRDWWQNLLYINNYVDGSECMIHTWYLAADTQLYYMAAIVFLACRTPRVRNATLSLLFVAGIIFPALHTYFQDLDGFVMISPNKMMTLPPPLVITNDPTFNKVYKRSHTNLTGYVIGMTLGYLVYRWQKTGVDPKNYQKYRFLYWSLIPLGCLAFYSGSIFYVDGPPPPVYVTVLYAALFKPVFGMMVAGVLIGLIFQFEDLYRPLLEWRGWTTPSRLTYCAYLLHINFLRNYVATLTTTPRVSIVRILSLAILAVLASFTVAVIFWMLVEEPFRNVMKEYLVKPDVQAKENEESKEVDKGCQKNEAKTKVKAL